MTARRGPSRPSGRPAKIGSGASPPARSGSSRSSAAPCPVTSARGCSRGTVHLLAVGLADLEHATEPAVVAGTERESEAREREDVSPPADAADDRPPCECEGEDCAGDRGLVAEVDGSLLPAVVELGVLVLAVRVNAHCAHEGAFGSLCHGGFSPSGEPLRAVAVTSRGGPPCLVCVSLSQVRPPSLG